MRRRTRRRLFKAGAALVGLALLGFLVVTSGLFSVAARPGHWWITKKFLHYAMERSVATHSLAAPPPPDLTDPALVLRGAGHYVTGCQPCHGGPGLRPPPVARAMMPPPPYLPEVVPHWKTRELFYIVKNGFKLTGMPAWPSAHREDEVWASVAFLLALPGLDVEGYRTLAYGETLDVDPDAAPEVILESCARCHGLDGNGRGTGGFPKIAGQRPAYLAASLEAYAQGDRHSGIMQPIAAGLDADDIRNLARYYAELPGNTPAGPSPLGPPSLLPAPGSPAPASWSPASDSASRVSGTGDSGAGDSGTGASTTAAAATRALATAASGAPAAPELAAAIARGARIAAEGIPADKIPACSHCHGPTATPRNPYYPNLAGQYPSYLVLQLELFKKDQRGGTPYARLMRPIAEKLDPEQMRDVALYYGSLAAGAASASESAAGPAIVAPREPSSSASASSAADGRKRSASRSSTASNGGTRAASPSPQAPMRVQRPSSASSSRSDGSASQ